MRGLARCTAFLILAGAMARGPKVWAQQGYDALGRAGAAGREAGRSPRQREFIGRAQALDKVDLRARVQGFLGPRKFKDGDQVKAGQLLFVIEPEPFEAAVEQHEGQQRVSGRGRSWRMPRSSSSAPRSWRGPTSARSRRSIERRRNSAGQRRPDRSRRHRSRTPSIKLSYTEVPLAHRWSHRRAAARRATSWGRTRVCL